MGGVTAEQVQKWFKASKDHSKEWRDEAREMYDLVAGWQWTTVEEGDLKSKKRLPIVMNRIAPYIDSIVGQQVNNRQEVKYLGRDTEDTGIADLYSEAVRWADDQCNAEDEITDAFNDMCICGVGATETRMDYAIDPEGMLNTAERIDPLEMYWDVNAQKRNYTDSTYVIRARRMAADVAEERWPKIKDVGPEALTLEDQTQPHDATEAPWYRGGDNARDGKTKEYTVLQCQYYEDKPVYRVADPDTGKMVTLSPKKFSTMKEMLDQYGVKYAKGTERRFYQCFVAGTTMLEHEDGPSDVGFTLKFMCGKRDRNRRCFYGIVRALKDPQKFSNKFFSDFLYILASNRKGGAFVEVDALSDPRKAEQDWNSPDALIRLNPGGLGKVRERDAGVFPAGLDRLIQYAVDAVPSVSGMSAELMGMADRQQAGVVEAQRKQSSLTILAPLFDSLRRYMKERGSVLLDMIRKYLADGRLIRITGENGAQLVPLVRDEESAKYDIVVDQSASTVNAKEETFAVLQNLIPFLAKMGYPIPPDVLKYLPIPQSLAEKWMEMLQQQSSQPDPQQEAEKMKLQIEQERAQIKKELDQMKMQTEQQKAALTMQQQQREAALKEREAVLKQQLEQQKFMLESMKMRQEADRMQMENSSREQETVRQERESNTRMQMESNQGDQYRKLIESLQGAFADAMTRSAESTEKGLSALAELITAPREVVRDEKGRAAGTRIKKGDK